MRPAVPREPAPKRDDDLSRTMAIARDPARSAGPGAGSGAHRGPGAATPVLALQVVAGQRKGEVIALDQANTMIGNAGGDSALVVKRGPQLFLARFSGNRAPRLNRADLGPGTHPDLELGRDRRGRIEFRSDHDARR